MDRQYVFNEIESTKIVAFPVHLATKHGMYQDASKFGIRITDNPHKEIRDNEAQKSRERLKLVIRNRLARPELIPEDAADRAVDFSGGNLRFLMTIMQKAIRNSIDPDAEETIMEPLTSRDVESGVEDMSDLPALSVMSRLRVLKYVMDNHSEPDQEELEKDFIRSILDNTILAYFNGEPWYDLNPIIRGSVEVYSKRKEE